jgi:PAS domain S-box-containing protein
MQKIIQQLSDQLARINEGDDVTRLKLEMQEELSRLAMEVDIVDFKLQRALKDKNVVNSLLTKTSEDLKSALQKQESQAEMLNILLDTIPALVYFKDSDLRYQIVNKAFIEFSGFTRKDVIGKTLKEVFQHYLPEGKYRELEEQVIKEGRFFYNVEELVEQNRKRIWVHTNIAPVRSKEGGIIGLIGISWDVSSQKNYEEQLKHARDLAEEGVRIKDLFLTNMSHEIRTPLNGIIGMAEILKQTKLQKKQEDYLINLLNSARHLMGLIEDVFEFSAIETGKYKPETGKFSLSLLLSQIRDEFKNEADKKNIVFQVKSDTKLSGFFIGDKGSLRIVLRNLLNNAIKFTNEGRVVLSVKPEKSLNSDSLLLRFEVKDTGIGVKNTHINKIFESFSQVDISTTKNFQGTGLGLAISKRLVEIMRGEMGVQSTEGKGSVFWFVIPLKVEEPDEEAFDESKIIKMLKGFRILMVEDNLINQKISKVIFEKNGCKLDVANNGRVGFEKYKKNAYDLILMDIQMPVMDGLETTRQIRQYEKDQNKHPAFIVALTANALESDRKKTREAGMDGFIAKPFNPAELFKILHNLIFKE